MRNQSGGIGSIEQRLFSANMGRLRYIGSKARIAGAILDRVGCPEGGRFIDAFCGTGVVSRQAALRGWRVHANDMLVSSVMITTAQLLNECDVSFGNLGGYRRSVQALNESPPREGFVFREYSPSGKSRSGEVRRYFSSDNARKIDGARALIEQWRLDGIIAELEGRLLIADLMEAANKVANIAGTYGCFLSKWSAPSQRKLHIEPRQLLLKRTAFSTTCEDACSMQVDREDTVYLDPPYTKRQYASYYHLLETIAAGDSPEVEGVSGLRPWEAKSSPFCYKKKALKALSTLATGIGARKVFISYNSEGHIAIENLTAALIEHGAVAVHALADIGRYRPNEKATENGESVTEFLIEFEKGPRTTRAIQVAPPQAALQLTL